MQTLKSALRLTLAAAAFMALGITAAWAPGSIPLAEVMEQPKDNAKLIDEINTELKKQSLDPEKVICIGARFGRQWENLGGARAIPYNCTVGNRTLDINGDLKIYDAAGKELDIDDPASPAKSDHYEPLNLTWKWS
jgi:hypothetical protein